MTTIISWTFHRGSQALTCAVEETTRSSFEVCVLPHWNLELSTVEHFADARDALRRHAEIALRLQEGGWVTEHISHARPGESHGRPGEQRTHAHHAAA